MLLTTRSLTELHTSRVSGTKMVFYGNVAINMDGLACMSTKRDFMLQLPIKLSGIDAKILQSLCQDTVRYLLA